MSGEKFIESVSDSKYQLRHELVFDSPAIGPPFIMPLPAPRMAEVSSTYSPLEGRFVRAQPSSAFALAKCSFPLADSS